ncbi:MAG: hypothetical protein IKP50_01235 [Bacilli bacterium]|jgi:hypothetical protein|nr:hypothetical protein [Bacilli bacterium]
MNMITLAKGELPVWSYILIFVAFFGLIVATVIIVKKFVKPLQIKKPETKEEDFIQEELDRILVPVEDEEIKKQMDEAAKKDGE